MNVLLQFFKGFLIGCVGFGSIGALILAFHWVRRAVSARRKAAREEWHT
jgi:hypothetical protein